MKLSQYNFKGELLQQSAIATGKSYGNKSKIGDLRTPEGIFNISEVVDASDWKHDFKDDSLGEIAGAYGPFFIRLDVPGQKGIGIHGTHDNNSLGTRASEGCIRLKNEDLEQLVKAY
jgi:lipoprotein-anchoring transpeptidase ErfK/SrfK